MFSCEADCCGQPAGPVEDGSRVSEGRFPPHFRRLTSAGCDCWEAGSRRPRPRDVALASWECHSPEEI